MDKIFRIFLLSLICGVLTISRAGAAAPAASRSDLPPPCGSPTLTPPKALTRQSMGEDSYPPISVALGEEGATIVKFTIGTDGSVTDVHVGTSSGFPRLDDAALEGIKSWRYSPATLDSKPVACTREMRIVWKLTGEMADESRSTNNVIVMTKSDYPPGAYERGEQGTTIVFVLIDGTGTIMNNAVVRSSGFTDLDGAAVKIAVSRWKPEAAKLSGENVKTIIPFMMVWSLPPR